MIIGAASMFFPELSVVNALKRIAEIRYGAVEVWMEHLERSANTPEEVGTAASELGFTLTVHAYSYDINIRSSNKGIRRESLTQTQATIEAAVRMGARVVVVHPGKLSSGGDDPTRYWRSLFDAAQTISEWVRSAAVTFEAMERRERAAFVTPVDIVRLFEHLGHDHPVGLTVDIAHTYTVMDPVEYLRSIGPVQIRHVHLSDCRPGKTHNPLGQGAIDLPRVLQHLRAVYDGIVSLEAYVPGRGTARQAEAAVCFLFSSCSSLEYLRFQLPSRLEPTLANPPPPSGSRIRPSGPRHLSVNTLLCGQLKQTGSSGLHKWRTNKTQEK